METRSRLILVLRGLPRPELQVAVYDAAGVFVARLDMAYPRLRLAFTGTVARRSRLRLP